MSTARRTKKDNGPNAGGKENDLYKNAVSDFRRRIEKGESETVEKIADFKNHCNGRVSELQSAVDGIVSKAKEQKESLDDLRSDGKRIRERVDAIEGFLTEKKKEELNALLDAVRKAGGLSSIVSAESRDLSSKFVEEKQGNLRSLEALENSHPHHIVIKK